MQIIQEKQRKSSISFELTFWRTGHHGSWGFGFPCNKKGTINLKKMATEGIANYKKCLSKEYDVEDPEVVEIKHTWTESRIGLCDICKAKVELTHFTNTCDKCGTDYNMSGQQLASREFWGEETNEHPCECV